MPSDAASVLMALGQQQEEGPASAAAAAAVAAAAAAELASERGVVDPPVVASPSNACSAGVAEEPEASAASGAEASVPAENLELRSKLETFSEERGRTGARQELGNCVKVLGRLKQEPKNAKLHSMRRDVLEKIVGEPLFCVFFAAGFEDQGEVLSWRGQREDASSEEAFQLLQAAFAEAQRACDLCLDPDSVTFAQVSELVQEGRTLPGIQKVDDMAETPAAPKVSTMDRPKKPWEK